MYQSLFFINSSHIQGDILYRIQFLKMVRNFQYITFNEHFELVLSVHL